MKATDLWREGMKPTISFELFPARSEKAAARMDGVLRELAALEPDFVSVTFGAGGSTREGSYDLVKRLMYEFGLQVIAYFACYGLGPDEISRVLDDYQALGVENILLVRGDIPHDSEGFTPHQESFQHADELVAFVRPRYDFCLGVAAYPEGHVEAASLEDDLRFLKGKIDNGAEFIITNYCYENRLYFNFVDRCRAAGIEVPILPGVMPIYSEKMLYNLARICGATVTDEIRTGLAGLPQGDTQALQEFGVAFGTRQCSDLLEHGVPGLHIYTMDRSSSTAAIIDNLRSASQLS